MPTVMLLGMMVSESSGSGAVVAVIVTAAVAETTLPSGLVQMALIVLEPALTPVTSPEAETVATVAILEVQLRLDELLTSLCSPELPDVPSAINWPVWPDAESDSVAGVMASAVSGSAVPPVTVKVAVAVTTLESGFAAMAVTVVVPLLTAVASPPAVMVATWVLLELQVTVLVKSSVAPEVVVPMAINWLVCAGEATDWVPGMMASDARLPPVVPPPPVTVMVAVALIDPGRVAVMVTVPADTAVAMPEEFTVATAGVLDDQVACAVTLEELAGWLPC